MKKQQTKSQNDKEMLDELVKWLKPHFETHVRRGELLKHEPDCAFCKSYKKPE